MPTDSPAPHPPADHTARSGQPGSERGSNTTPEQQEHHPAHPEHDLSDSAAHARSPEEYTAPPGSHRRDPDGKALDVGG